VPKPKEKAMKALQVVRSLLTIILLAVGFFCLFLGVTKYSPKTALAVVENSISSRAYGDIPKPDLTPLLKPQPEKILVPLTAAVKPEQKKPSRPVDTDDCRTIRFFPAEVAAGLEESFKSVTSVDSSVWRPKLGWPTARETKWLIRKKWGGLIKELCAYFGISDCVWIIEQINHHESAASPWAVNVISGATGNGQLVYKTAKYMASTEKCKIPIEFLNRSIPEQNLLITTALFATNLATAKKRGYKNYRDWAILYHYAGSEAAEDTAANHGGLYNVPFIQSILAGEKMQPKEAPLWAQKLWAKEDWATIENIRRIAGGEKPVKAAPIEVDFADALADSN
jgi:hypothetical protein